LIGFLWIAPEGGNFSVELGRFPIDIARSVPLMQAMGRLKRDRNRSCHRCGAGAATTAARWMDAIHFQTINRDADSCNGGSSQEQNGSRLVRLWIGTRGAVTILL
jgi:hypothetical protein